MEELLLLSLFGATTWFLIWLFETYGECDFNQKCVIPFSLRALRFIFIIGKILSILAMVASAVSLHVGFFLGFVVIWSIFGLLHQWMDGSINTREIPIHD